MNNIDKKKPFLGCFEIALFMKRGINHFDDSPQSVARSFIIVFLNFIFTIATVPYIYAAKEHLQDHSIILIITLFATKFILCFVITLFFIYYLCKIIGRKNNFLKFVIVSNWCTLIPLILFFPIFILLHLESNSYDDLYPATIFISVYAYALAAFVIRYVIDIPWELAAFITICTIAINEASFDLLYYILD